MLPIGLMGHSLKLGYSMLMQVVVAVLIRCEICSEGEALELPIAVFVCHGESLARNQQPTCRKALVVLASSLCL